MANISITGTTILIHGRGSGVIPYKLFRINPDKSETQLDLTGRVLYFEIDEVAIRELMTPDPNDPLGKIATLETDQVVNLSKTPTPAIIRDETEIDRGLPVVLWEGSVGMKGYIGNPDKVPG